MPRWTAISLVFRPSPKSLNTSFSCRASPTQHGLVWARSRRSRWRTPRKSRPRRSERGSVLRGGGKRHPPALAWCWVTVYHRNRFLAWEHGIVCCLWIVSKIGTTVSIRWWHSHAPTIAGGGSVLSGKMQGCRNLCSVGGLSGPGRAGGGGSVATGRTPVSMPTPPGKPGRGRGRLSCTSTKRKMDCPGTAFGADSSEWPGPALAEGRFQSKPVQASIFSITSPCTSVRRRSMPL